ncbi:hypothetical protein LOTGIDRAFT_239725 [Lottia gigantea]|uniref:Death domain-containing protein n=1 Tax=Lottia gigantea TaxID=225164 RepID=V4AHH4_LOTGI|nr:hypothetical protein LOTGIDRAFT_239725 [Lottia gigantea]ESP03504.1 hypothetical protein LOTGIDRAFT_239725 [Lottia gigantea]
MKISLPIYRYSNEELAELDEGQSVQTEQSKKEGKDIDIIPLYCAILGAVVVGLLGYVIMVHYRRIKEKRLIREPHDDVEYSKASAGDSGICVEVDHQQKITPGFSTKKIANCELKSQRDSTTPLKQLLTEWSRNEAATVGILIQAMKNLGRHDVLPALNVYNSAELRPLMPQSNIV